MALKSIEQEWQGLSEMVFRSTRPGMTQICEMQKAFFAGAWAMFTAVEEIGEDHITEEQGFAFLESRKRECLEFREQIMREYSEQN